MKAPTEQQRFDMICEQLCDDAAMCFVAPDVSIMSLATQTAALVASDIATFVFKTRVAALARYVLILVQ